MGKLIVSGIPQYDKPLFLSIVTGNFTISSWNIKTANGHVSLSLLNASSRLPFESIDSPTHAHCTYAKTCTRPFGSLILGAMGNGVYALNTRGGMHFRSLHLINSIFIGINVLRIVPPMVEQSCGFSCLETRLATFRIERWTFASQISLSESRNEFMRRSFSMQSLITSK